MASISKAWKGKSVIVTGSTSGIGQATALLLARAGANVVVHGQSTGRLESTLDLFEKEKIPKSRLHHVIGPIDQDLTQHSLIGETLKKFGKIDSLISNAGTTGLAKMSPTSIEAYDHVFRVNTRSNYTLCKLALEHLQKTKGSIVIVSSIASIIAEPQLASYQCSKAAVDHLIRNLAIEYANYGVRVNGVRPGLIHTNIGSNFGVSQEKMPKVYKKYIESKIMLGRMGKPSEVANLIEFLASENASFITGSLYDIDGGISIGPPLDRTYGGHLL